MKIQFFITLLLLSSFSGCLDNLLGNEETENSSPPVGLSKQCILHDDKERCWLLLRPANIPGDNPPLVIDMHGGGDDVYQQYNTSRFAEISERDGIVIAYPQGYDNLWNQTDGLCCGEEDDFGFILEMIEEIKILHAIDDERIYASGWSNGCGMAQRLAVQASDVFAAAACMSMYQFAQTSPDYSPIPFMEVHGLLDEILHYPTAALTGIYFELYGEGVEDGAIQNLEEWADLNNCQGLFPEFFVIENDYDIRGYSDCENGAEVRLMTLFYAQHNPYINDDPVSDPGRGGGNPTEIPSTEIIWDFMKQYSKD
jgi:polyhydroxybutyrate depolymerase